VAWIVAGLGVAGAWLAAAREAPVPAAPTSASAEARRPSPSPDPERVKARQRRALEAMLERHAAPTRLVKVRAVDCGLLPAAHAEVTVTAGGEIVKGLADDVGVFRAPVPAEATTVTAVARVDDGDGAREGLAAGDGAAGLDVVVCPGASVEGWVVDRAGRPLADAVVSLDDGQDVAVTAEDGEFVLTDTFLTARVVLVEHAAGLAQVALAPPLAARERRPLTLVVDGTRRVTGRVVDRAGADVPNAPIVALDGADQVVARATSDRDGRFWLKALPFAPLRVRADGGPRGLAEVALAPGDHPDDLVLRLDPALGALTVVWTGAAAGVIHVSGVGVGDDADPVQPGEVVVASGVERWVATPGLYRARVQSEGGEVDCGEVFIVAGQRALLRCGAPAESRLVARVLGPEGRPRAGVSWWVGGAGGERQSGVSDGQGRILATLVLDRAARVDVEIAAPDQGVDALSRRNVTLVPGQTTDLGDLHLRDAEAVRSMFTEHETGRFGGLGAALSGDGPAVSFAHIVDGGPLDRAGVRRGDVLLDIDGESAAQLTTREVTLRLRGTPGSRVSLRLLRPGEGELDVQLERALIDFPRPRVD